MTFCRFRQGSLLTMGLFDMSTAFMSAAAASLAVIYMYLYKLKPKKSLLSSYDYIVVGGGSAGCVVASRLSEDPTKTVLLLEAGPEADDFRINVPAASPTLQQSDVDWNYQVRYYPWQKFDTDLIVSKLYQNCIN